MNVNALLQQFSEQQVAGFMLVIARIAPLFLLAPMFSSKMIPSRVKGIAAVGLAVGIAPLATKGQHVPLDVMGLGALMVKELLVGLAFAFSISVLFAAVSAKKAHSTPDRLAAMVLLSPVVLPPAAKKHPHATIPAQTGKAATPSATYVHPVIRIPMLMASATSTSMGPPPAEGDCNGRSRHSKPGRSGRNT